MNGVSAFGEFFAEFRSDDAATAVGRVYRDADVHCAKRFFVLGLCFLVLVYLPKHNRTGFKDQRRKAKDHPKKLRQATLAIACLYLNLTHLLRGGK